MSESNEAAANTRQPDQRTPLLGGSVDAHGFQNPFRRGQRLSFANSLPTRPFLRQGSSSSSVDDKEIDIDPIQISYAHVGSFSTAAGLDPGRPFYIEGLHPRRLSKAPSKPLLDETSNQQEPVQSSASVQHDAIPEDPDEDLESQFRGVSPLRFWLVFSVIMMGYFIACFDSTLMASSHPVITSYFEASQAASWLSTVFLITSTAFQPLFGRLSDTVGRKSIFLLSFFIFGLTTLWCALAGSIESFIAARAVCGIGAGGTMSMSLIIVSDLVRIEDRGIYQSHLNFAFGLGSASGAALGGYLCDTLGWRWSFGVQVPFLAVCCILGVLFTPKNLGPMLIKNGEGGAWAALRNFDFLGSLFLLVSVTTLILALNLGGNIYPWASPVVISCFAVCGVTTVIFIFTETRARQPLMPMRLLTKPPIANLVFINALGCVASSTVMFNIPLFFQAVLMASASDSGLRLAVPSIVGTFAGVGTGYVITYTRKLKPTLTVGVLVYLAGSIAVTCISRDTSELLSLVLIAGVPLAQGLVLPAAILSALAISPQADQAVVTTTIALWRNLGIVLGVSISSLVFQNCLLANLDEMVVGPEAEEVIRMVRSSVQSIRELGPPYQGQVIDAYAAALRLTFVCTIVAAVVMNSICLPMKLPRLRAGRKVEIPAGE